MIANKWYCIAQTNTFDTSCSVNISFDATSVLFTASVKFGKSSINIASCTIEDGYVLSVRLRETESSWAIDLLSNVKIEPNVSIADSNEWTLNNAEAGSGSIIAIISNIDSKFNSNTGTGGGDSYWQRVNLGSESNPIYAVVPKNFNDLPVHIVSYGEVSSAGYVPGAEGGDDSGSTVVFTPILTSGKEIAKIQIDGGEEQSIYAPEPYDVDLTGYATEDWVRSQGYLGNSFATSTTTTLTAHDKRIKSFEDIIGIDENGDVYIKKNGDVARNFYSYGEISSGGLSDTESGDGSVVTIEQILTEGTPIANVIVNGVDNIIYAPENSGVSGDYLPIAGGTLNGGLVISTPTAEEVPLTVIRGSHGGASYTKYYNADTYLGSIGIGGSASDYPLEPYFEKHNGSVYQILHNGNIHDYGVRTIYDSNYLYPDDYGYRNTFLHGYQWDKSPFGATRSFIASMLDLTYSPDWRTQVMFQHSTYQPYITVRCRHSGTTWTGWYELIHSGNIGSYITTGGSNTPNIDSSGIPYAGTVDGLTTASFTTMKTFIGTFTYDDGPDWYNAISVRHRNGQSDGNSYGMLIRSNLTKNSDLLWRQQFSGGWQNWKTLLDSNNYSSYALPLSGGTITGNLKITGGKDYAIWAGVSSDNRATLEVVSSTANPCDLKLGADYDAYWSITARNYTDAHSRALCFYSYKNDAYRMIISDNGNVLIGTTTDNGGRLQVAQSGWESGLVLNRTAANSGAAILVQTMGVPIGSFGLNGSKKYEFNVRNSSNINVVVMSCDASGNFTATGEVTSGSDERYKRIESYAEIDIETIANAPIINFRWTDREDNKLHLGSTAQYWYNTSLCNGVIPTDDEKLWTMGYGQIALAGLVSVAKKVVNHEERIAVLEKENKQLKQQLNEYRRV